MTVRYWPNKTICNFRNFVNVFFTIVPANIIAAVAAPVADQAYTGRALTPGVSLSYNGMNLKEGMDYTLAYKNNTAAGRAEITVTGKGNYSGSKTVYFNIAPGSGLPPTGSGILPPTGGEGASPTPSDSGIRPPSGTDTVPVSGAKAAKVKARAYTGKALKPAVTLTYDGKKLKSGTDYTLSYKDNKAPGKAQIIVTGKGRFTGEKIVYFDINPAKAQIKKLTPGKRKLTVTFKKPAAAQKATGTELRYRIKGTSKWKTANISAKKSSYVIKKLKKGKKYQIQLRTIMTIKSGKAKGAYRGAWSTTKTSKAVK
jgi:hypothetical protein